MQKYTAIILSSHDIGEFDRLYILYTLEQGLVKAVAKGVRKPAAKLAGHLEPGTLSEVYVARARGMGQITSAITLSSFENIKKDFEKLQEVLKIFKFFGKIFSEGEKDERIFELLKEFLLLFDSAPKNDKEIQEKLLAVGFWWKLFDALGNRPETMKCVKCVETAKEEGQKFFSAERGGIICEKCATGKNITTKITANQIKLLRIFLSNPLGKILKVKVDKGELDGLWRIQNEFRKYNF